MTRLASLSLLKGPDKTAPSLKLLLAFSLLLNLNQTCLGQDDDDPKDPPQNPPPKTWVRATKPTVPIGNTNSTSSPNLESTVQLGQEAISTTGKSMLPPSSCAVITSNDNSIITPPIPTTLSCEDKGNYLPQDDNPIESTSFDVSTIGELSSLKGFRPGAIEEVNAELMRLQALEVDYNRRKNSGIDYDLNQLKEGRTAKDELRLLERDLAEANKSLQQLEQQAPIQSKKGGTLLSKLKSSKTSPEELQRLEQIKTTQERISTLEKQIKSKNEIWRGRDPFLTSDEELKQNRKKMEVIRMQSFGLVQGLTRASDGWKEEADSKDYSSPATPGLSEFMGNFNKCNPNLKSMSTPPLEMDDEEVKKAIGFIRKYGDMVRNGSNGKTVYIRGSDIGLNGLDLQFNPNGTVQINNLRPLGQEGRLQGGAKVFTASVEYPSGRTLANMYLIHSENKDMQGDLISRIVAPELRVARKFKDSDRIATLQRVIYAPNHKGERGIFIQTPLMDGDLNGLIKKSDEGKINLTSTQKELLWSDMTRAMREFHAGGFIHMDIKPHNFLIKYIDGNPRAFLIDFDTAIKREEHSALDEGEKRNMTPAYDYNREGKKGVEKTKIAGDYWALGLTGYLLANGKPSKAWYDENLSPEQKEQGLMLEIEKLHKDNPSSISSFLKLYLNPDAKSRENFANSLSGGQESRRVRKDPNIEPKK